MRFELDIGQAADLVAAVDHELAAAADRDTALSRLTRLAVAEVPGAELAGVTSARSDGSFRSLAGTDELVRTVDDIQYDVGSGPCVDAVLEGGMFATGDLRHDERWPEFGRRAAESTGVASMLSFRLFFEHEHNVLAGLNLYSTATDAFDPAAQSIGLLLASGRRARDGGGRRPRAGRPPAGGAE